MVATPDPRAPDRETGTREHLLDAAEELFGEQGYAATSLRQLTAAAGANVAAVNYHFGGKEELCKAVLARRIEPINADRLARLEAIDAEKLTLEAVVRAFVEPPLRARGCGAGAGDSRGSPGGKLCRVFGRVSVEQPPFLRDFLAEQFHEVAERFGKALHVVAPHVEERSIWWRLHFLVGGMAHTLNNSAAVSSMSRGLCNPDDVDRMIDELVAFAIAGFPARLSGAPHPTREGKPS